MFSTVARQSEAPAAFSKLHKSYVQGLYRRFLRNSLDWNIQRNLWREDAQHIRAEFEHNRNVKNPRELATVLQNAEKKLSSRQHPDPYKPPTYVGGTKWYVETDAHSNLQGAQFADEEKSESLKDQHV